ncbi:MAG: hypothetical protein ABSF53_18095 [Terracidiphilus sp.]
MTLGFSAEFRARSLILRCIVEKLPIRHHLLVQYARYENAVSQEAIEQYMLFFFEAIQTGANPVARPAQHGISRK